MSSQNSEDEAARLRSEAARLMGKVRSERKTNAARANATVKGDKRGPKPKPLNQLKCNCDGGDTLNHKSYCPRGRAIRQRQKEERKK